MDLAIAPSSVPSQHTFITVSGTDLPPESAAIATTSSTADAAAFAVQPPAFTGSATTASAATTWRRPPAFAGSTNSNRLHHRPPAFARSASANTWHRRLGHPNSQVLTRISNTVGSGVQFTDSLTACSTCRIQKSTQAAHPKTADRGAVTQRLQLVCTDLLGPLHPPAIGDFSYMAKFTDYSTRLKAVYFLKHKSDALSSLLRFVQDVAIPLGLRVQTLHSDQGGEYVSAAFRS